MTRLQQENDRILQVSDESLVETVITLYENGFFKRKGRKFQRKNIKELLKFLCLKDEDVEYWLNEFNI